MGIFIALAVGVAVAILVFTIEILSKMLKDVTMSCAVMFLILINSIL